jgi:hypothetical protein
MDFDIKFVIPPDGNWGVVDANGSFNGMVGILQRNWIQ